jgi:hypothetical protein
LREGERERETARSGYPKERKEREEKGRQKGKESLSD